MIGIQNLKFICRVDIKLLLIHTGGVRYNALLDLTSVKMTVACFVSTGVS